MQEKSSSSAFNQLESSGESQSFINEPITLSAITTQKPKSSAEEEKLTSSSSSSHNSPEDSPQRKSLYDLSQLGDNELIVREEKRVSISWSRDNSPAPNPITNATTTKPCVDLEKANEDILASSKEIAQGARKKTLPSPLKSSHETKKLEETAAEEEDVVQKPLPSKALLQKIAMKETEPRKK